MRRAGLPRSDARRRCTWPFSTGLEPGLEGLDQKEFVTALNVVVDADGKTMMTQTLASTPAPAQ